MIGKFSALDEFVEIYWGNIMAQHEADQKIKWVKCPTLIKDFYKEHPMVTDMNQSGINLYSNF